MDSAAAYTGFDAIGVMRTERLSRRLAARLSACERRRYERIQHESRRTRWLAGRLLSKQLFLRILDRGGCHESAGAGEVTRIEPDDLKLYPEWLHRAAEILPSRLDRPGCSFVNWSGRRHSIHLSISHTHGCTAVCLSRRGAVGVDLEAVHQRSESFYAGNFTTDERRWADAVSASLGIRTERAYTLLWCLKESVMKLRESDLLSLWELPRIEIRFDSPAEDYVDIFSCHEALGERLADSKAGVIEPEGRWSASIAVTGTANLMLTCVRHRND